MRPGEYVTKGSAAGAWHGLFAHSWPRPAFERRTAFKPIGADSVLSLQPSPFAPTVHAGHRSRAAAEKAADRPRGACPGGVAEHLIGQVIARSLPTLERRWGASFCDASVEVQAGVPHRLAAGMEFGASCRWKRTGPR
jgi:hypothetical protein